VAKASRATEAAAAAEGAPEIGASPGGSTGPGGKQNRLAPADLTAITQFFSCHVFFFSTYGDNIDFDSEKCKNLPLL
jgi:hypothetical protein